MATASVLAPQPNDLRADGPAPAPPAAAGPVPSRTAELTVVVPCRSEAENVPVMVERLRLALAGVAWEVVFVDDDSPDGTAAAKAIAARDRGCAASGASAGAASPPPASKGC